MKDLYTFDTSPELAIESYRQVSGAYKAMFERLKLPIIVAEASSGDMGGDHSHEYHLAHGTGSDTVLTCDQCDYAANDEVAVSRASPAADPGTAKAGDIAVWRGVSKDRKTSVNVWYCKNEKASVASRQINIHAVKSVYPEIDTAVTGQATLAQEASKDTEGQYQVLNIVDGSLAASYEQLVAPRILDECQGKEVQQTTMTKGPCGEGLNLLSLADGDGCPRCESGSLHIHRALELGHTFYLGTRYTKPFEAKVALPYSPKERVELEMGCYGIGVSRIFAAVAEHLVDEKGLNWPRIIAPFEAIIIPTSEVTEDTLGFYDFLTGRDGSRAGFDAVLDDRKQSFGRKMQDAEATGYPVSIILGKGWKDQGLIEVQCRRLGVKEKVPVADIVPYLDTLLSRL
jgi:prolyl-tRNA synthetase